MDTAVNTSRISGLIRETSSFLIAFKRACAVVVGGILGSLWELCEGFYLAFICEDDCGDDDR